MKKITLYSSAIIAAALISSCKKYEDGPMVSLKSRKERVANTWVIDKALRNNEDVTKSYDNFILTLSKDGDAKLVYSSSFLGVDYSVDTDGTWEFQNKDEKIAMDFKADDADNTYTILKLKEDELWLRETGGEDELHLKPR